VCVVDDTWAIVGSDNFNRRSWTHDSELSCAVIDEGAPAGAAPYPRELRVALSREHLGTGADTDLGPGMVKAFRQAAANLDAWHGGGAAVPVPQGNCAATRRHGCRAGCAGGRRCHTA
jgi:phosphatidylserine/phosphatidylglycerophosphate/cardiolipin synthase-like enzyme